MGLKFRRQFRIGPYVVDFVCLQHRLIIEADGPFHDAGRDAARDAYLVAQCFRILRFSNREIEGQDWAVIRTILDAVRPNGDASATPHPAAFGAHLLPQGEKDI